MNYSYGLDTPIIRPKKWIPDEPVKTAVPAYSGEQTQDHRAYTWVLSKPAKPFMEHPQSSRRK
jgi:hypothetical protein